MSFINSTKSDSKGIMIVGIFSTECKENLTPVWTVGIAFSTAKPLSTQSRLVLPKIILLNSPAKSSLTSEISKNFWSITLGARFEKSF